jgi:sterol 24-C-methyltransferase
MNSISDVPTRSVDRYDAMFGMDDSSRVSREAAYRDLVERYYDLVTDFYERGWGTSFHFAPRFEGESFEIAIQRHEHQLALRLDLQAGMRVLDVGCGVGSAARCAR